MKCVVCGFEYDGTECPQCQWPNVQINGDQSDYDEWLRQNRETIEEYRKEYYRRVGRESCYIGIRIIKRSMAADGSVKPVVEDMYFGKTDELAKAEKSLAPSFVAYPNINHEISITLLIKKEKTIKTENVVISDVENPGLYRITVTTKEGGKICLKLYDKNGLVGTSKDISINEDA